MSELFLFAGFLGSGKTTLLKNVLQWSGNLSRTVVLVNELGKVGIDGQLLAGENKVPVVELANGCICCTMRHDLVKSIREIQAAYQPERILIEATGVADPAEVLETFRRCHLPVEAEHCRIITVVNAELWENRDLFGPLFANQVKAADLVLCNKIDLIEEPRLDTLLQEIQELAPRAAVVSTHYCQVAPQTLWRLAPGLKAEAIPMGMEPRLDVDPVVASDPFTTFAFINCVPFRRACFERFIGALPTRLYRVKGFARLDAGYVLLDYSHGRVAWTTMAGDGPTRLTFIGQGVDREALIGSLESCLMAE